MGRFIHSKFAPRDIAPSTLLIRHLTVYFQRTLVSPSKSNTLVAHFPIQHQPGPHPCSIRTLRMLLRRYIRLRARHSCSFATPARHHSVEDSASRYKWWHVYVGHEREFCWWCTGRYSNGIGFVDRRGRVLGVQAIRKLSALFHFSAWDLWGPWRSCGVPGKCNR